MLAVPLCLVPRNPCGYTLEDQESEEGALRKMTYDIYISGPMTGIEDFNYPAFHTAAATLRAMGLVVFNPAESFDGDTSRHRCEYMRKDIEALLVSRSIVMLDGWQESDGARLEAAIALEIGVATLTLQDFVQGYKCYGGKCHATT